MTAPRPRESDETAGAMTLMSLRLPPELVQEIQERARRTHSTVSATVRELLAESLREEGDR